MKEVAGGGGVSCSLPLQFFSCLSFSPFFFFPIRDLDSKEEKQQKVVEKDSRQHLNRAAREGVATFETPKKSLDEDFSVVVLQLSYK